MEPRLGVRELKSKLSEVLRRVRDGESVTVTMHGKPVGRIVPYQQTLEQKLDQMVASGAAAWSGRPFATEIPQDRPMIRGARTLADIVVEDRA